MGLRPACHICRENHLLQKIKVFFFPKKAGQVGGDRIQHPHQFIPAVLLGHEPIVGIEILETCLTQPFGQPGTDQFLFALMQIDAAFFINQGAEPSEISL